MTSESSTDRSQVDNTTALIAEALKAADEVDAITPGGIKTAQAERDRLAAALEAVSVERDSLSRLHEVATERTVALSAVIEKAKAALANDGERDYLERIYATGNALASAPADVLREHDAEKWDEGKRAGYREQQKVTVWAHRQGLAMVLPRPVVENPYRNEGGN